MTFRDDHEAALARARVLEDEVGRQRAEASRVNAELARVESERDRLRLEVERLRDPGAPRAPKNTRPDRATTWAAVWIAAGFVAAFVFVLLALTYGRWR